MGCVLKVDKVSVIAKKLKSNNVKNAEKKSVKYDKNDFISNIYYQPVNFTRKWLEHQSWGVRFNADASSSVKIFTFPDVKSVSISLNTNTDKAKLLPLNKKKDGIFVADFEKDVIKEGDKYRFVIQRANGSIDIVKDPYSFKQPDILGESEVYDHNRYQWQDSSWYEDGNSNRISRIADSKNGFKHIGNAKIYELNVATLTQKGNLDGVKDELNRIKDAGFNAIEIMPVENTYSYNWGYDGVDKFAVAQYMGGPDKLKELVDEAHKVGLNVIMDMVPNHLGPDGAQLQCTGPYISGSTPWGDAFNYEGKNSRYVRDYIVNAALNWIDKYHCDGLRLDMTQFMKSDITMQLIAAEVNYHFPHVFLIAEDGRSNISVRGDEFWNDPWQPHDQRVTNSLKSNEIGLGENEGVHDFAMERISNFNVPLSRLGFDSEWDFHFYHTITKLAYGETDLDSLERAIVDSGSRVKYSTSHDEIGNMDGTRLVAKYMVPILKLNEVVCLNDEDENRANEFVLLKGGNLNSALCMVKSQKVQQISMKLAQMVQDGRIEEFLKVGFFDKSLMDELGIKSNSSILPADVLNAFSEATKIYRAIETLKYFTPGPVMTFQGEENIDMTKFNFFREFDSIKDEKYLYIEKGYPNGISAYLDSKLGVRKYSAEGKKRMQEFQALIKDLNKFKDENPASTVGKIVLNNTVKHRQNPTIALHSKDLIGENETFIVSNFSNSDYPLYEIEFPKGKWVEIINSNNKKYGGSGACQNSGVIEGFDGKSLKSTIALPAKSSIIFKKL